MISIEPGSAPARVQDIGDGVAVLESFEATVEQDEALSWGEVRGSRVRLLVAWNDAAFRYEILELRVVVQPGADPITGSLLRALPVMELLKASITQARVVRDGAGVPVELAESLSGSAFDRLKAQGPKPETLDWVSRIHKMARIKLEPPTQYVADVFEIPHRTASHWIKLARERGNLTR